MEKRKEKSWDAYLVIDIKEKTGKEEIWKKRLTAKTEYVMMFRYENAEAGRMATPATYLVSGKII